MIHNLRIQCFGIQQMWSKLIQPSNTQQPHRSLNLIPHNFVSAPLKP